LAVGPTGGDQFQHAEFKLPVCGCFVVIELAICGCLAVIELVIYGCFAVVGLIS